MIELILDRITDAVGFWLPVPSYIRHFFEFLAQGTALATGIGLGDPCVPGFPDVFAYLSPQSRYDLTSKGQVRALFYIWITIL